MIAEIYSKGFDSDANGGMSRDLLSSLKEFKSTGTFWSYHGRFYDWIHSIDNEFIRQKIKWVEEDVNCGFANFYYRDVYLQKNIDKPWVGDSCIDHISNDQMINFISTEIAIDATNPIKRDDYHNIYDPVGIGFGLINEQAREDYGMIFYDKRVDALALSLEASGSDLQIEFDHFRDELENQIIPLWKEEYNNYKQIYKNIDDLGGHNMPKILEQYNGGEFSQEDMSQPWFDLNYLCYSPTEYIHLGNVYFKNFTYRSELSDKNFKVFTRTIDDNYQWAIVLFASGGSIQLWDMCRALLLIIKTSQSKPIKPKDVIYQEHYLFLHRYLEYRWDIMKPFTMQIQRFYYTGYYIDRYIVWMQDRVMKVIYDV